MSLHPQPIHPIPAETIRVAQAAFPKGTVYMRMRDELGTFFTDEQFEDLFPARGQPAASPWQFALVTLMQFAENLTDRQAADAVRGRIDWKYALGLELTDAGFHYSVLSEFRQRLVTHGAEARLFETMLAQFAERGWVKARGHQRTDSTHIVAAIRSLNRLELVGETLRAALNDLAGVAPEWLKGQVSAEWYERYRQPITDFRLPKERGERLALGEQIGRDGRHLLQALYSSPALSHLRTLPSVELLRQVWVQQFYQEGETLHWRSKEDYFLPPSAQMVASPYDSEARYSCKRGVEWWGYKVHLTESCEPEQPFLIVQVLTTPANLQDLDALDSLHQALAAHDRLPQTHLVDSGYIAADKLVAAQEDYQVELLGPTRPDCSWQAQAAQGFDLPNFQVDWEAQTVTCPQGHHNRHWKNGRGPHGKPVIEIQFDRRDCTPCPVRALCTRSQTAPRCLTLHPAAEHQALLAARARQKTESFKRQYAARAGVEGTIAQSVHGLGMRRSRYRGLAKTHLHHVLTAAAINLFRAVAWLADVPRATSPTSRFAALVA